MWMDNQGYMAISKRLQQTAHDRRTRAAAGTQDKQGNLVRDPGLLREFRRQSSRETLADKDV